MGYKLVVHSVVMLEKKLVVMTVPKSVGSMVERLAPKRAVMSGLRKVA